MNDLENDLKCDGTQLEEMAAKGVHERVVELLKNEARGAVLDAPSGSGALAKRLGALGFSVHCCDLNPDCVKAECAEVRGCDLNKNLPYPDNHFEYACCIEGIEHLENPHHLIKEFGRVLKNDGKFIISTPNVSNIVSRIHYLLYGWFGGFEPLTKNTGRDSENEFAHINPVNYHELGFILEKCGFEIETVTTNKQIYRLPGRVVHKTLRTMTKVMCKFDLAPTALIRSSEDLHVRMGIAPDDVLYGQILIIKAKKCA